MPHLKRYMMPGFWGTGVKKETFVVHPRGPHPIDMCIPLRVVLRDLLGLAGTSKEASAILNQGMVLVDKKPRKDGAFSVGLMDVIEIPETKQSYTVMVGPRGLTLKESKTSDKKLCKITGKKTIRGGKDQLNLHDGKNIIAGKKSPYKPGDTLAISLQDQKILSHLKLKEGSEVLIIKGRSRGLKGTIKKLPPRKYMMEKPMVVMESGGKEMETLRDYVFVIKEAKK